MVVAVEDEESKQQKKQKISTSSGAGQWGFDMEDEAEERLHHYWGGGDAMMMDGNGSDDPDTATLIKVDGVQPLDSHQDTYSMYVFRPQGSNTDIVSNEILSTKGWEPLSVYTHIGQLDALARELNVPRSEVFFIDIGANVGAFSLGAAAAGFSVIAIEAMTVNQLALSMSICSNIGMAKSVTLLSVALGRENHKCGVYSGRDNALDGNIRCDVDDAFAQELVRKNMIKRQDVDIVKLDDLLGEWMPRLKDRVGALKIDTEGFEPWVFEGAERFLNTVRPRFMQLEVSTMSQEATNVTGWEMLSKLVGVGGGYELRESAFSRPIHPTDIIIQEGRQVNVFLFSKVGNGGGSDGGANTNTNTNDERESEYNAGGVVDERQRRK